MNIKSLSIREYLEMYLNKFYENITYDDLLKVTHLKISKVGIGNIINTIYLEDLNLFPNIEILELDNIAPDFDIIKGLSNLKVLKLTNSLFDGFDHLNLNELYLNDCEITNITSITNIVGLSSLSIINMNIDLKYIVNYDLKYLNLNNSVINNIDLILKQPGLSTLKIIGVKYEIKKLCSLPSLEKVYTNELDDNYRFKICNEEMDLMEND